MHFVSLSCALVKRPFALILLLHDGIRRINIQKVFDPLPLAVISVDMQRYLRSRPHSLRQWRRQARMVFRHDPR